MRNSVSSDTGSEATLFRESPSGERQSCSEYSEVHFGDVLGSWNNGVQLDLRVKLAIEFLKSGMLVQKDEPNLTPMHFECLALRALDLSTALLTLGAERGLVKALPETGELSGAHRHHLERLTRAQLYPQLNGNRIAEDEGAPSIQRSLMPVGGLPRN